MCERFVINIFVLFSLLAIPGLIFRTVYIRRKRRRHRKPLANKTNRYHSTKYLGTPRRGGSLAWPDRTVYYSVGCLKLTRERDGNVS